MNEALRLKRRVGRYCATHRRIDYVPGPKILPIIQQHLAAGMDNCLAGVIDRLVLAATAPLPETALGSIARPTRVKPWSAHHRFGQQNTQGSFDSGVLAEPQSYPKVTVRIVREFLHAGEASESVSNASGSTVRQRRQERESEPCAR